MAGWLIVAVAVMVTIWSFAVRFSGDAGGWATPAIIRSVFGLRRRDPRIVAAETDGRVVVVGEHHQGVQFDLDTMLDIAKHLR